MYLLYASQNSTRPEKVKILLCRSLYCNKIYHVPKHMITISHNASRKCQYVSVLFLIRKFVILFSSFNFFENT